MPGQPRSAPLLVMAAGSLQPAFEALIEHFRSAHPHCPVNCEFGPSGLLRDRLAAGDGADLFAAADLAHPQSLHNAGLGLPPRRFAGNRLCVLARYDGVQAGADLLALMLRADVRIGTSTPGADPAGDYAWRLFERADRLHAGAGKLLRGKALLLSGSPSAPKAPDGRNHYAWLLTSDRADLLLTYTTNALAARRDCESLQILELPPDLAIAADYGLIEMHDAQPHAGDLAAFILGSRGRGILARFGFDTTMEARA